MHFSRIKQVFFSWGWSRKKKKKLACAPHLPKEKVSLLLFAEGEDVVQRGCRWRGCPAEEGPDAERGSAGRRQPGGAARVGQTLFASPAFKCGPRTQLSQQVACWHPCKSKCTVYGTAHGSVASFLIPFAIEINQQKHKHIVVVVHLPSRIWLFATPWTTARQAPLSFIISQRLLRFLPFELVIPSNHLELCLPHSPFTFSLSEYQSLF